MLFKATALVSAVWTVGMIRAGNVALRTEESWFALTVAKESVTSSTWTPLRTTFVTGLSKKACGASFFAVFALNTWWTRALSCNGITFSVILTSAKFIAPFAVGALRAGFVAEERSKSRLANTAVGSIVTGSPIFAVLAGELAFWAESTSTTRVPEIRSFQG